MEKNMLIDTLWGIWKDSSLKDGIVGFKTQCKFIISASGAVFVSDEVLVNRLLDKYQEREVDSFNDSGISVEDYFYDNVCHFKTTKNDIDYYINLTCQTK